MLGSQRNFQGTDGNIPRFLLELGAEGEARMSQQSDKIDIERAAFGMVRAYREKAELECLAMIDRWEKRGDTDAVELWHSVLKMVRRGLLADGQQNHGPGIALADAENRSNGQLETVPKAGGKHTRQ